MKKTKRLKKRTQKSFLGNEQEKKKEKEDGSRALYKKREGVEQHTHSIEGILRLSASGYGRIILDDKTDIKIEKGFLNTGLNNDIVQATVGSFWHGKQKMAHVEKIIKRAKTDHVGTLKEKGGYYYLKPQDPRVYMDIIIPKEDSHKEALGKKVLVTIENWSDPKEPPEGKILRVIGKPNTHETEMLSILLDKGIEIDFDTEVENEAKQLKKNGSTLLEKALKERTDYRDVSTFTIDPDDAKDFDDAISYQTLPNGDLEIGVHIADVSHYVQPGTALDKEAVKRGTSTYLVDRTVPMLPEILSNDLCSLNPKEDKLVFSTLFTFSKESIKKGVPFLLKKHSVEKLVINSNKRFTYEEAQKAIDTGEGEYATELRALNILSKKIAKQNKEKGALSFSQGEVKFVLDKNKRPVDVYIKKTGETNEMIESFMLLANKTVTEFIQKKVPKEDRLFIYRIHDKPDKDRVLELVQLLRSLGYTLHIKDNTFSSKELNQILRSTEGTSEANIVQMATIRSMAKAIYSIQNIGHFGLAFENYTHFTSPIRRYPDIIVHRLLKTYLEGKKVPQTKWSTYQRLAQELSNKEKDTMDAERSSIKYKQVEYLSERKDEKFSGTITSITEWGIYVEEEKTRTEGLIRIRNLGNDFFRYDKIKMALIGSKTKKSFRLGDTIKIKIKKIDINNKTLEYELAG